VAAASSAFFADFGDSMGFWSFGGNKKKRSSKLLEPTAEPIQEKSLDPTPMARGQQAGPPDPEKMSTPDGSKNQVAEKPGQLPQTPASTSRDPEASPYSRRQETPAGAASSSKRPAKTFLEHFSATEPIYSSERGSSNSMYHQNPASRSSIGPENFSVVRTPPTLRKRIDHDQSLPRHKSSKRKAEEHAREQEVRAMSSPIPITKRPSTRSEGLLQTETKKIPGDLNKHLERPKSQVSLPLPETFSEMNDPVDQHSFKVSAFAILSPRPTIRYDGSSRIPPPRSMVQSRASARQLIAEEDFSSKKRIDDLADDLDSGGLRELMERDRRRRERRREGEKAKLHRKLQRRADRQREDEQRKAQGLEARPSTPKGKNWRADEDLGRDTKMSSSPPAPEDSEQFDRGGQYATPSPLPMTATEPAAGDDPFADESGPSPSGARVGADDNNNNEATDTVTDPFSHPEDNEPQPVPDTLSHAGGGESALPGGASESIPMGKSPQSDLPAQSLLRTAETSEPSRQATVSPPTPPEQVSAGRTSFPQPATARGEKPPDVLPSTEASPRDPEPGAQTNTWASFFKRGGRRKRSSTDRGETPSEFSNTSRESFSRQQPPPIVPPRTFRRSGSGTPVTPQRTRSKFREDLPELPLSPPDSRMQSPEIPPAHHAATATTTTTAARHEANEPNQSPVRPVDGRSVATSSSIPATDRSRPDDQVIQQRSMDYPSPEAPPPVLSQSLASVDSEGSWLSGKPVKRSSGQLGRPFRQSQSSLGQPFAAASSEPEENDVAEDEYFHQLTPAPEETRRTSLASERRKASSTIIDPDREGGHPPEPEVPPLPDRAGETWHGSVGRQAMIVRHTNRAKSNEGLLNEFLADEVEPSSPEDEGDAPNFETPAEELQESPLMRARSVDYGKGHARHISAGSARLLDIRRSSVQSEGLSTGEKSPSATRGMKSLPLEEKEKSPE
jgi:hypothetical protein